MRLLYESLRMKPILREFEVLYLNTFFFFVQYDILYTKFCLGPDRPSSASRSTAKFT